MVLLQGQNVATCPDDVVQDDVIQDDVKQDEVVQDDVVQYDVSNSGTTFQETETSTVSNLVDRYSIR